MTNLWKIIKKYKVSLINIRNKRGDITAEPTDVKREYYKQLYINKLYICKKIKFYA